MWSDLLRISLYFSFRFFSFLLLYLLVEGCQGYCGSNPPGIHDLGPMTVYATPA